MTRSNLPPGYSEDGDAATHARDTAMYQELVEIRSRYQRYKASFRNEAYNDEMVAKMDAVEDAMDALVDDINQPL